MKKVLIDRQQLIELVKQEAANLRKHATKEQLNKLKISKVNGNNYKQCIYGLMTGDCRTKEAHNLIIKCANRVYSTEEAYRNNLPVIKNAVLNGPPKRMDGYELIRVSYYISPIEKFIYKASKVNIRKLVNYLKGKTEELDIV